MIIAFWREPKFSSPEAKYKDPFFKIYFHIIFNSPHVSCQFQQKRKTNLNKKLYSKLPPQITPIQNFKIPTSEGENYYPEDSFQKKISTVVGKATDWQAKKKLYSNFHLNYPPQIAQIQNCEIPTLGGGKYYTEKSFLNK